MILQNIRLLPYQVMIMPLSSSRDSGGISLLEYKGIEKFVVIDSGPEVDYKEGSIVMVSHKIRSIYSIVQFEQGVAWVGDVKKLLLHAS